MGITRSRAGGTTHLALSPALHEGAVEGLRMALEESLGAGETRLVLDLAEVTAADSCGLEFLLEARDAVAARGGSFSLANPSPLLREILQITRLDHELEIAAEAESPARCEV